MTLPVTPQTAAMIAGTIVAAAGLNLGVMSLGKPESTTEVIVADEAPAAPDEATITSAEPAPASVAPAPGSEAQPATSAGIDSRPVDSESDEEYEEYEDSDESSSEDDDPQPTTTSSLSPTVTTPTSTVGEPTASESPTTSETPTSEAAVSTEFLTYEFQAIATIIIALHDGMQLEFWSAMPEPGVVYQVERDQPDKIKVKFLRLANGQESEFEVKFKDGELDVKMEA